MQLLLWLVFEEADASIAVHIATHTQKRLAT